jgi:hypothetical protein
MRRMNRTGFEQTAPRSEATRQELEVLDRDTLIRRAEALGVARANVLTRPELVDEILVRGTGGRADPRIRAARGLFGRARDLLAKVIERGLHLPDAAEIFRARPTPTVASRPGAAAVPTVTLAEIYVAQGHKERAVDTLRRVLENEPDHSAAKSLLAQIEKTDLPPPVLPPEEDEPAKATSPTTDTAEAQATALDPNRPFLLDDEPLPPKYDVDECVAIPVDPTTMFVYWEVRDTTRAQLEKTRPGGEITLRALIIVPTWEGPRVDLRDFPVHASVGDFFVRDLPRGAVVRTAIGWRANGAFVPSAHSPALETLPSQPSPLVAEKLVRWTPEGSQPILDSDQEMPAVLRALGVVTARLRAQARAAGREGMGNGDVSGAGVTSMPLEDSFGGAGVSSFH